MTSGILASLCELTESTLSVPRNSGFPQVPHAISDLTAQARRAMDAVDRLLLSWMRLGLRARTVSDQACVTAGLGRGRGRTQSPISRVRIVMMAGCGWRKIHDAKVEPALCAAAPRILVTWVTLELIATSTATVVVAGLLCPSTD